MEKIRLDKFLNDKKMAPSRDRAINLIKAWKVLVNSKIQKKPSFLVFENDDIHITESDFCWVSRAGLKLDKAVKFWNIDLNWKICADIWASTWWFCDVLLEYNASKIFAVDVWHSQLHAKIRASDRIINLEHTNARYLTSEQITEKIDFFCSDVSFISITKILPSVLAFLRTWWTFVILVKPQFELYPEALDSRWVVKNWDLRLEALQKVKEFILAMWCDVLWIIESPIKWGDWNIEFLLYAKK